MSTELTTQPNEDAAPPSRIQRIAAIALSASAFVLVYVALSGPVAMVHKHSQFGPMRELIEIVYAPVVFCAEHRVPLVSDALKAYLGLFI